MEVGPVGASTGVHPFEAVVVEVVALHERLSSTVLGVGGVFGMDVATLRSRLDVV